MVNQATILGRVGKISTKSLSNNMKVTNISMVTSKKFVKDGERQEKSTWHNVVAFSKVAEIAEKYVAIGDLLYVQGEMDTQKYTSQDGQEKTKTQVIATTLQLMPKAKEHKPAPAKEAAPAGDDPFMDDNIPF